MPASREERKTPTKDIDANHGVHHWRNHMVTTTTHDTCECQCNAIIHLSSNPTRASKMMEFIGNYKLLFCVYGVSLMIQLHCSCRNK